MDVGLKNVETFVFISGILQHSYLRMKRYCHRTNRFDAPLKLAFLFALPVLFAIWLGLSIAGSVLLGVGYGFFSPWVSAFEAFRQEDESKKFFHCLVVTTLLLLLVPFGVFMGSQV